MPRDDGSQPRTYRILDAQGQPIGRVRVAGGLPLGRGAGTVLLIRDRRTGASGDCSPGAPIGCCDRFHGVGLSCITRDLAIT